MAPVEVVDRGGVLVFVEVDGAQDGCLAVLFGDPWDAPRVAVFDPDTTVTDDSPLWDSPKDVPVARWFDLSPMAVAEPADETARVQVGDGGPAQRIPLHIRGVRNGTVKLDMHPAVVTTPQLAITRETGQADPITTPLPTTE